MNAFTGFILLLGLSVTVGPLGETVAAMGCHGGDTSNCVGFTCTMPDTDVGCEHDVCTCVHKHVPKKACVVDIECSSFPCDDHDQRPQCIDANCECIFKKHHGPRH